MNFSNKDGGKIIFELIKTIQDKKDFLSEVDGKIGDGDHGINMNKGFTMTYCKVNGKDYLAVTDNYDNVNTQPKDDDATTYAYYVGDWDENGYARILKRSDHSETEYGVDKWYNLYKVENGEYKDTLTQKQVNSNTDIQQNIFYKGSAP